LKRKKEESPDARVNFTEGRREEATREMRCGQKKRRGYLKEVLLHHPRSRTSPGEGSGVEKELTSAREGPRCPPRSSIIRSAGGQNLEKLSSSRSGKKKGGKNQKVVGSARKKRGEGDSLCDPMMAEEFPAMTT